MHTWLINANSHVFLILGTIPAGLGILTFLSPWRYICSLLSPNISCVPGRLVAVCSDALGTVGHLVSSTGGLCSNPSSNVVLDPVKESKLSFTSSFAVKLLCNVRVGEVMVENR